MLCPSCRVDLKITDRQGVEIDFCPQCRGVWLERGELDKIIDRATIVTEPPPTPDPYWRREQRRSGDWDDDRPGPYRKRRRGWLDDLFDFD